MTHSRSLHLFAPLALAAIACAPSGAPARTDIAAWERRAENVTITRDDWGIPHIHGKTDADAVFGLIYAQAEDDFNRIEMNYLKALGRTAEAEGPSAIWNDLRVRLAVEPDSMKSLYASAPDWMKQLATAWADGLNFYLAKHPAVHPKVLTRFEPWMVLAFSEGSIGWDIESVSAAALESFYGAPRTAPVAPTAAAGAAPAPPPSRAPGGSNGIAIAPSRSASGAPLLLINPHTSFFFRAEAQVQSDEGLNAYGALTWGQFFVYQGFNERLGWMHTSTSADVIDEYAETIVRKPGGLFYKYGGEERPVTSSRVKLAYRTASGTAQREFTVYRTHHGPIVREANGKWIAVRVMQEPVKALMESFLRTKATTWDAFAKTMELQANSSNNTVYADADGNIAFFNINFVPKRNPRLDFTKPVDGSDPATDWVGLHTLAENPNIRNPASGWIQNTNNGPWSAAGPASPRASAFPSYMDQVGENPRGLHAMRVISASKGFTLDSLIAAAFDRHLTAFDELLPPLFAAYRAAPASHPLKTKLAEQVAALEGWDRGWSAESAPMSLAVYWAQELWRATKADPDADALSVVRRVATGSTPDQRLQALAAASDRLVADFGNWRTPWGEINRFQRITGDIAQPFSDAAPSTAVGFTSGQWGSLAAFEAKTYPGTKRMYGTSGNSFVAAVEFGPRVRARAVTAGGENGDPRSLHFADQVGRYATGALRDVYFYRDDLEKHIAREYHPGA